MSIISRMYGGKPTQQITDVTKNPNRVAGGLRGQGADHYTILGEDGMERTVPTHKYVQALEDKLKSQDARLAMLEKRLRNLSNEQRISIASQRMANQPFRRTDDL